MSEQNVVLTERERERVLLAYRDGVLNPGEAVLIEAARIKANALAADRAAHEALRAVIDRYFDLTEDPWEDHDAACPGPDDLWRMHRDLRAALAAIAPTPTT